MIALCPFCGQPVTPYLLDTYWCSSCCTVIPFPAAIIDPDPETNRGI